VIWLPILVLVGGLSLMVAVATVAYREHREMDDGR
jgi:hypothetical protein